MWYMCIYYPTFFGFESFYGMVIETDNVRQLIKLRLGFDCEHPQVLLGLFDVVTDTFAYPAAGAGLTGTKMARRTGDVDEFEFKAIGENHNQGVSN